MTFDMIEETVLRVSGPSFMERRHEATGHGWVVGAHRVRFSDGTFALHVHYDFASESEAVAKAKFLRGKMQ